MPSVEEELILTLRRHADTVPADPALLTVVKARSRRAAAGSRFALTAGAAAAVALIMLASSVAIDLSGFGPRDGLRPAAGPDGFLVDTPPFVASFPLTPTYLPSGLRTQPNLSGAPGSANASYVSTRAGKNGRPVVAINIAVVWAAVLPARNPPLMPNDKPLAARVHGHPATFVRSAAGSDTADITWRVKPGQWVILSGTAEWSTRGVVLRVADGLVARTVRSAGQFKIKLAPPGFKICLWSTDSISLAPCAVKPSRYSDKRTIQIWVTGASDTVNGRGKPVTIGTHTGWLQTVGRGQNALNVLVLKISAKTRLMISASSVALRNAAELSRFASGVEYLGPTHHLTVD